MNDTFPPLLLPPPSAHLPPDPFSSHNPHASIQQPTTNSDAHPHSSVFDGSSSAMAAAAAAAAVAGAQHSHLLFPSLDEAQGGGPSLVSLGGSSTMHSGNGGHAFQHNLLSSLPGLSAHPGLSLAHQQLNPPFPHLPPPSGDQGGICNVIYYCFQTSAPPSAKRDSFTQSAPGWKYLASSTCSLAVAHANLCL